MADMQRLGGEFDTRMGEARELEGNPPHVYTDNP